MIKQGLNVAHEEQHHVGLYAEHDTKDFKRLWGQLAFTPSGKDYSGFVRVDFKKHFVSLGGLHHHGKDITHAYELQFDAADGAKGLGGQPVSIHAGSAYHLSESTTLKAGLEFAEHYGADLKVEHKLDSHWTLESHQEFCSGKLKEKSGPYDIGFKVSYKL